VIRGLERFEAGRVEHGFILDRLVRSCRMRR
jgi:hypothetical protein